MTQSDPSAHELLVSLKTAPLSLPTEREVAEEAARLAPWLEAQVGQLPMQRMRWLQRKRYGVVAATVTGIAAAALLGIGLREHFEGGVDAVAEATGYATLVAGRLESGELDVLPGSRFGLSSRVRTGKGDRAIVRASAGYELALARDTEVAFLADERNVSGRQMALRVSRGEVSLAVPKLAAGSSLSVLTADCTVKVVGTRFSVGLLGESARPSTCVRVDEGRVEVLRSHGERQVLGPGQSSGCEHVAPPSPALGSAGATAPSAPVLRSKPVGVSAPPAPKSALREQNALLAAALAAERRGDRALARRQFRALLTRYPSSPFAQDARAGLERLAEAPR